MVLEAWENAESIWYYEAWKEAKDDANVIDYNINEEQTKDEFAKINANNQTTTGMANVIPWVNAPKLLAGTSVIWAWWGWWWGGSASYSELTIWISATMPAAEFNYFDDLSVSVASSDVTLDADNTKVRLTAWIYAIFIMIHIHKNTATFTVNSNYVYPNSDFDRIVAWDGTWWNYNCFCWLIKSDGTWFFRVWINPTQSIGNVANSLIRVVKIW